ncbi:MAG TPA: monovalent cation/H+ antiporter complex subunit F [Nocardioides sp.]|nr:monovalent cation/H+ antiporter complex subunit F [Nocardioides sp.]
MNPWLLGALALVGVGLPVAIWIGARGDGVDRLVGLELAGVIGTLALLAFAQAVKQPSYLIVPTVAVVVSFAGTLVYTRLLAVRS